jgi:hypothetical protein
MRDGHMSKPNIIIRLTAAHWDARVRLPETIGGTPWAHFNFRNMDKKGRSTFHRELMNAFRANRS